MEEVLQKRPKSQAEIEILNLKYDLTPQKYLSMIVCEIGNIPPHSVPVVIREIMHDYEDDQRDHVYSDSDDSDEDSNEEDEGDEDEPAATTKDQGNQRRMQENLLKRKAQMQMVSEEDPANDG